jgi:hypothetical protein
MMELRDTIPALRASLDGNDTFVSGGHQVMKTAGATRHAERMKKVPVWALDDEKIKELIKLRFPLTGIDLKQRKLASRMIRLIHLYYRVGATADVVAEELKMTRKAVQGLLRRLNRQMERPLKPSHRPKKKGEGIQTESEVYL